MRGAKVPKRRAKESGPERKRGQVGMWVCKDVVGVLAGGGGLRRWWAGKVWGNESCGGRAVGGGFDGESKVVADEKYPKINGTLGLSNHSSWRYILLGNHWCLPLYMRKTDIYVSTNMNSGNGLDVVQMMHTC